MTGVTVLNMVLTGLLLASLAGVAFVVPSEESRWLVRLFCLFAIIAPIVSIVTAGLHRLCRQQHQRSN
jgi:uncharacterized membrane protein HdeD (DUF308 family)